MIVMGNTSMLLRLTLLYSIIAFVYAEYAMKKHV